MAEVAEGLERDSSKPLRWEVRGKHIIDSKGVILVKRSILKRKNSIWAVSKREAFYREASRRIRLMDATLDYLEAIRVRVNAADRALIDKVIDVKRRIDVLTPAKRDEEIEKLPYEIVNATISGSKIESIRYRYAATQGIHIRWPWQSILRLPAGEITLNTSAIFIETRYGNMSCDVDYRYTILDPVLFARNLQSAASETSAKEASKELNKKIGFDLDQIIRDYVKGLTFIGLKYISTESLLKDVEYQVINVGKKYGIDVSTFVIKKVKLPSKMSDVLEEGAAIDKRNENIKRSAEGERNAAEIAAVAKVAEFKELVKTIKELFPELSDKEVLEEARKKIASERASVNIVGDERAGAKQDVATSYAGARAAMNEGEGEIARPLSPEDRKKKAAQLASDAHIVDNNGILNETACSIISKARNGKEIIVKYKLSDVSLEEIEYAIKVINSQNTPKPKSL